MNLDQNEKNQSEENKATLKNVKDAKAASSAASANKVGYEDGFYNSPTFPKEVYNNLPELLKDACIFSGDRENDMFLNAALAVISGCLFNLKGVYDNNTVYPNFYGFNMATAASGKGVQKHATVFASTLGEYLQRKPIPNQTITHLIIPANSSTAAMIDLLSKNGGIGVINETELDTLSNALSQEWSDFSSILRSNFHHEAISTARKLDDKYTLIENPRFSMSIAGTYDQYYKMFSSTENGLFSRGAFYCFKEKPSFRDVRPNKNKPVYGDRMKALAEKFCLIAHKINTGNYSFDLQDTHWDQLVGKYKKVTKELGNKFGSGMISSIRRLGLIEYKLAMILSGLCHIEQGREGTNIIATDVEYNTASMIAGVYLKHLEQFIESIPTEKVNINKHRRYLLLNNLPVDIAFGSAEAIEIGKELGIKERSIATYLKDLVAEEHLSQGNNYGKYKVNSEVKAAS